MRHVIPLILAVLLSIPTASIASSLTLDFADRDCALDDWVPGTGREGPITYTDPNQAGYGWCGPAILLGDDGWMADASISADPGYRFDLKAFDIISYYGGGLFYSVRRTPLDPSVSISDQWNTLRSDPKYEIDFKFLEILGFRNGHQVARRAIDPNGLTSIRLGKKFRGLDAVTFRITTPFVFGGIGWVDGQYYYACGLPADEQCGAIIYDNVWLNLHRIDKPEPAAVPLPASLGLFGAALAALGITRRRR